jgi:hypothetical protein
MNWKKYVLFRYWQLREKKCPPRLSYRCGLKMKNPSTFLSQIYKETRFYG